MLGFIGAGLTSFFASIFQAYILSKNSMETSSNIQTAMSRISLELQNASPTWIISNGTEEISYFNSTFMALRTIRSQNNSIEILPQYGGTAHQLLPGSMTIAYIDTTGTSNTTWVRGQTNLKLIQVTITVPGINLTGTQDLTFTTRIVPRG